jgi:hypothetical protein
MHCIIAEWAGECTARFLGAPRNLQLLLQMLQSIFVDHPFVLNLNSLAGLE